MNIGQLKKDVYEANMELHRSGLVLFTFGNVSGIDRERGIIAIKPSGVSYDDLSPETIVCVGLHDAHVIDGCRAPSIDTGTHRALYRAFPRCGGIVHTHSEAATACAQARVPISCAGTTHADYFRGDIPVTRPLTADETATDYEYNTGMVIAEAFSALDYEQVPAVLVAGHGPFAWGESAAQAVHNAILVEFLAKMHIHARALNPAAPGIPAYLIDKHYLRKHGSGAYYGQKKPEPA